MRPDLLKILTTDDIQEILDACELLWNNYEEPNADNIIRQLLEENGCPPSIGLRFPVVLSAAELATGRKLSWERSKENTTIRALVAFRLREEGYTNKDIGKMLRRDHSTVTHLCNIVRNMLSVPNAYREEIAMYERFIELCQE